MTSQPASSSPLEVYLDIVRSHRDDAGDGQWLEDLVLPLAPRLRAWDLRAAWTWADWPARTEHFGEHSSAADNGIDCVAERRDGAFVAIQCKGRGRSGGRAGRLVSSDVDAFAAATDWSGWAERWIVTNAAVGKRLREKMVRLTEGSRMIRHVLIEDALMSELHRPELSESDPRTLMQKDAVTAIVSGLDAVRSTADRPTHTWAPHESRGHVVLPCSTGKTRIGYEVSRSLSGVSLSVVLVPSIGLVRQMRLAWLDWSERAGESLRILCVCSDRTVVPSGDRVLREQDRAELDDVDRLYQEDLTDDRGLGDVSELTGTVEGHSDGIARWLSESEPVGLRSVVICTYQSSHELASALRSLSLRVDLLICDEAHRTSGIRVPKDNAERQAVRRFTLCHDRDAFPARNRLYMTATAKHFAVGEAAKLKLEVRSMDDETTFGPRLYTLSYRQAVERGLLVDYRIVACSLGTNAHDLANRQAAALRDAAGLAADDPAQSDRRFSSSLALRKVALGLALARGIPDPEGSARDLIEVPSLIAFFNRIKHSQDLAAELSDQRMQDELAALAGRDSGSFRFTVEHLDSGSDATTRESALGRMRSATGDAPHAVTNVGIFGEGIDTPSLAGIAFMEPKRSMAEIVQNVGRAMRLSPGKRLAYVFVLLDIPPWAHAEAWLESQTDLEGWEELGQLLRALARYDGRIEHDLTRHLHLLASIPSEATADHLLVVDTGHSTDAFVWHGETGGLEFALSAASGNVRTCLEQAGTLRQVTESETFQTPPCATYAVDARPGHPVRVAPVNSSWSLTGDAYPARPATEQAARALRDVLYGGHRGRDAPQLALRKPRRRPRQSDHGSPDVREPVQLPLLRTIARQGVQAEAIRLNLLERSGLMGGPERDFNVLRETVERAAESLRSDGLENDLRQQFQMHRLSADATRNAADGCTVAALMLTVAGIMHARLEAANVFDAHAVASLESIARSGQPAEDTLLAWNAILLTDYQPIFVIARDILQRVTRVTRRTSGLDAAVRAIAGDAVEIAESYAHMGMDYAGELFNQVMGNQSSDGAYFTRPIPALMLGELAAEALHDKPWDSLDESSDASGWWRRMSAFDPTCGSATLLVAYGAALRRRAEAALRTRAEAAGHFDPSVLSFLHRQLVERLLMGMDINPVSLQLGAAQLTLGDLSVRYGQMNLRLMPYGTPSGSRSQDPAKAGTLELLSLERVVGTPSGPTQIGWDASRDSRRSHRVALRSAAAGHGSGSSLEAVANDLLGRRVAIMNPPFVQRDKLGAKFERIEKDAIVARIDALQQRLVAADSRFAGISDKTTTRPLYVALGLKCIDQHAGVLAMVVPTVALTAPGGLSERRLLANQLRIRWVVTCHQPGNVNVSQRTQDSILN